MGFPINNGDAGLAVRNNLNALAGILPPLSASIMGQVATGCALPNQLVTSKTQLQSRSPHIARDAITALKIRLPGFYVNGASGEKTVGAPTTYTASVEYPAGTFQSLSFGGMASGTAPDGGMATSDILTLATAIPPGNAFWIQVYGQCASGIVLKFTGLNTLNGAKLAYASSGLTDQTATGTITNSGTPAPGGPFVAATGYAFYPCAILAQTTKQSFYLLGDSRFAGSNDNFVGVGTEQGSVARALATFAPCINGGISGDTIAGYLASNTNRQVLAGDCSSIICGLTINDVTAGTSVATMQSGLQSIAALSPGKPFWMTTSEPVVTAPAISVSSLTSSSTVCTATVASTAALKIGQYINIMGASAGYTGSVQVTSILSATTFTYNVATAPGASPATGTITYNDGYNDPTTQIANAYNANRVAMNFYKKAIPSYAKGCLDIAQSVEAGLTTGILTTIYGSPTIDGTHMFGALYQVQKNSGVITPMALAA